MAWSHRSQHSWVCQYYLVDSYSAAILRTRAKSLTLLSWSVCRCHRSCVRCHTYGSHQDPPTSPTPLHGRSPRCTQVSKRCTRTVHSCKGGGCRRTVARCVAHSTASRYQPGCKLHNLLRVEVAAAGLPWHNGPAGVADILHWSDLWCDGTLFERAH